MGTQKLFGQCNLLPPVSAFTINGTAYSLGHNEFRLTESLPDQGGAIWYSNYLNLDYDFSLEFEVFLGSSEGGADGMAFVLQQSPQGTSALSSGGGIGYKGISPSLDIEYDTWANPNYQDPGTDHIAIHKNGKVEHTADQITGPQSVSNMEDGKYHRTKIVWETASQSIKVFWDSEPTPKITKSVKMKTTLFAGNPYVYWGWTGSTGMEKNLQKIKLVNIEFKQKLNVSGNVAASTCADPTGAIDFTVLGGVEPLYYSWSNGATTQDIFSLVPGEYTVIVTDACGNAGSSKFIVGSVNVPPIIQCTANIVIDNTPGKCAADYVMYNIPQLTGGCSAALIKQIVGLPSGSTFPMGTTINTFAITTAEGVVSNCSFTVIVQ